MSPCDATETHDQGAGALHPMNFDPGGANMPLRDWAIAFFICMVVMLWRRIFRLAEAEAGKGVTEHHADSAAAVQPARKRTDRSS